jgi:hypothetical protein
MTDVRTPFPLTWPVTWPRAKVRGTARFSQKVDNGRWNETKSVTIAVARDRLQREIDLLGARDVLLSTNVELRLDGQPRSDRAPPTDPGVALYFKLKGRDTVLACDRWDRVADNIVAITKHIEAIRGMDRWGVGSVEQVFTGYQALPAPIAKRHWTAVLGVPAEASRDAISAAYRSLARECGTDQERLLNLNLARDEALAERTLS